MYLDTRSDASTANPAQDSRIVLIIIGSTILLVILVMVVIQPTSMSMLISSRRPIINCFSCWQGMYSPGGTGLPEGDEQIAIAPYAHMVS